ncbi:MAG: type IV secretion system DNA-binding domain-containing protein [Ruminococcus sp.]|nr:type IV secretion system DNA-binding domain-containing protein [Ruminococcus sp.]
MSIKKISAKAKEKDYKFSIKFAGKDYRGNTSTIYIPDTSIALISPPGKGKTVFITEYIKQSFANSEAVSIIFDAKAELYKELYQPGDVIISSKTITGYPVEKWNIFSEIYADSNPSLFAQEITQMIFADSINKSHAPVFPQAASEIFYSVLYAMIKERRKPYNEDLVNGLESISDKRLKELAQKYPELSALNYLAARNETAFGIRMELVSNLEKLFPHGSLYREKGNFSVRNFIQNCKGKKLFVVFPFDENESLSLITSVFLDLAMKEVISRPDLLKNENTRFFIYLDEFACLPELSYLIRVNDFGRSKGARLISGIQSYSQLERAYGTAGAQNILSSFNSIVAFKPNDDITRSKLKERCGKKDFTITPMCDLVSGENVITDKDLQDLGVAEAIMMLNDIPPFFFDFYNAF